MNRHLSFVKFLVFLLVFSTLAASDFELFLGKGTAAWENVRTVEDRRLVTSFKRLYKKNMNAPLREKGGIPQPIHLIWLGPNAYPEQSLVFAEKWHELHPDWTFFCWSDIKEEAPLPWMVLRSVSDFEFTTVGPSYDAADNFKEKAFLLTLEILHAEGGIYLDHDVELKDTLSFVRQFDFFGSLAPLQPSIFSSSVFISPHLLAGIKGHPFFTHAMHWYRKKGAKYQKYFPGSAPLSCIYRTQVRIYESLRMGVKKGLRKSGYRDCLFPPKLMEETALHESAGSWKLIETIQEQKIKKKIESISAQIPVSLVLILMAAGMIPLTWIVILRRRS